MDLGGIVAAGVEVEAMLLRIVEPFFAQFPGHQRIDPGGREFAHNTVPAAAAKRDGTGRGGTELDGNDPWIQRRQLPPQISAPHRIWGDAADRLAFMLEKPPAGLETKLTGQQRVIADFPVGVEREVTRIEGAVAVEQDGEFLVDGAGDRPGRRPEKTVMNDEKIHAGGGGLVKRGQPGVNRGADMGDAAVVGDLQAVAGAREVRKGGAARTSVAVSDDLIKSGHALL